MATNCRLSSNTHIFAEAQHDQDFRRVMARFDLVLPNGMPVVWALNWFGAGLRDPVYAPYFMRHVLKKHLRLWLGISVLNQGRVASLF